MRLVRNPVYTLGTAHAHVLGARHAPKYLNSTHAHKVRRAAPLAVAASTTSPAPLWAPLCDGDAELTSGGRGHHRGGHGAACTRWGELPLWAWMLAAARVDEGTVCALCASCRGLRCLLAQQQLWRCLLNSSSLGAQ